MPRRVLVPGGSGFVGRHAVAALIAAGASVVVGTRRPEHPSGALPSSAADCERRRVRFEALVDVTDWPALIEDVDVVLNCVGILRPVAASTYDAVHHRAPEALAAACAALGKRFVHVSALGLHDAARSAFLTSKLAGERRIRASGADWILVRPSLLDGDGGFGARWLRGVARLPVFFAPMDAHGRIAALHVEDLGEALSRLCLAPANELDLVRSREFDLGGRERFTFRDYIRRLRRDYTDTRNVCVPVPGPLARLFAHACDVVHFSPFSFGHWELLRRDNVPAENRLPELLRRPPRRIGQDAPTSTEQTGER